MLPDSFRCRMPRPWSQHSNRSIEAWAKDLVRSINVLVGGVHRADICCVLDSCTGIKCAFNPGLLMPPWSHQLGSPRLLSFRFTCPELNLLPIVKCSQNHKVQRFTESSSSTSELKFLYFLFRAAAPMVTVE